MARLIFHIDVNSAFLSWEATRRVGGAVKDLLIAGIGGQQTALNGSFQQKHNDQAVHHRQITIVQPHTVANPEQRGKHHNCNGHPLELPAAGDPALHQHHHHEVEAHDDKIAHDDVIEPVIAVFQIKVDEAIVKHENLLVQVVGKNGNQHNRGRNQKVVQLSRMGIILRLAQIIDDKRTQGGDEQHTHIEAVPEVAHQRMGHAAGEIPFDNFVNEPEQEQAAHHQHQPPYIFVDQPALHRDHPGKQQGNMDRVPDQAHDALEHCIGEIFIYFPHQKGDRHQNGCHDGIASHGLFLTFHFVPPFVLLNSLA